MTPRSCAGQPERRAGTASRTSALDRLVRRWLVSWLRLRRGAPQPGSGQAREEWCFPPLPGEPHEGFRPLRATRSCVRPSGRAAGPGEASTAFGRGGASRPVRSSGRIGVWCPMTTGCPPGCSRCVIPGSSARGIRAVVPGTRRVRNGARRMCHRGFLRIFRGRAAHRSGARVLLVGLEGP
jgi:hypothetical protein